MENNDFGIFNVAKNKLIEESFLQNGNDLNLPKLSSLMSLLFKEKFKNDTLVQYFEVNILRPNAYEITDCKSLTSLLIKFQVEENDDFKKQIIGIFIKIFNDINKYLEEHQIVDATGLCKIIDNSIEDCKQRINDVLNVLNSPHQKSIPVEKLKSYTLSPTQGIAMLNNNPYSFFVSKVLKLQPIDDWNSVIDVKTYGILVHKIMECFAKKCINCKYNKGYDYLKKLFSKTLSEIFTGSNIKITSFLQKKLENIGEIAIELEYNSIQNYRKVFVERSFKTKINGVEIYAKADRIEVDAKNKFIYIFDYKTGNLPHNSDEINGTKPQLLVIAMLILKQHEYKDFSIKKMEYIDLSGKEKTSNQNIDTKAIAYIEENIKNQIDTYFQNGKPIIEKMQYIKPFGFLYDSDIAMMKLRREKFIPEIQ